ncbi:MAG: hypothetical protein ACPGNV_14875 [Mangrovicoccus sp.]
MIRSAVLVTLLAASPALADLPVIEAAKATPLGSGQTRIDVTLRHPDTGWDHYANGWTVYSESGAVLGHRELLHPHVQEQPFTRSLTLSLPDGLSTVLIKAQCLIDGETPNAFRLTVK